MQDLLNITRRLRGPGGCPWDQQQTHTSLRPHLLEEAAEAADAISDLEGGGSLSELKSELGDVLFQVAFHSVLAEEAREFTYAEVEQTVVEKLMRRHPHVFGSVQVSASSEVERNWQTIKDQERAGKPRRAAEQVPRALGALAREQQTQKLAAQRSGAHVASSPAISEAELGQRLAQLVTLAQASGLNAEHALRAHTNAQLRALDAQLADPQPSSAEPTL